MSTPTIDTEVISTSPLDNTHRRDRRRRRVRAGLIVLCALVAAAAVWLVWFSSVLAVKQVRVVGVEGPQSAAVLSAASVPLGAPLARVDADSARDGVMRLPWVSSAEIRRGWPNEVVIAVEYRTPIAVDAVSGRAVDAEGVVFDASGSLPKALPKVTAQGAGMVTAMAVLSTLPPDLAPRIETISATTRDDVDLVLHSGAKVHWGSADQVALKARVLQALLKHKRDVYDVTAPELPTTFVAK
jgi:cell division protein FtsQ